MSLITRTDAILKVMKSQPSVYLAAYKKSILKNYLVIPFLFFTITFSFSSCIYLLENGKPSEKISVLIVDGFSNHDWRLTTRLVSNILNQSGRFDVHVSTCPDTMGSEEWKHWNPDFNLYDVVIQNCNNIGKNISWPNQVESNFESYIKQGGGVYILHSANNSFPHWQEYNNIIGLGWRPKDNGPAITIDANGVLRRIPAGEGHNTSHGKRLDSVIEIFTPHPINYGYPTRWKTPLLEVYEYARGPAENLTVLSYAKDVNTGKNWPIEWVVEYGNGRVYNSTLGHVWDGDTNPASMRCIGFQTTLIRVLEWLATEHVTFPIPENFPTEEFIHLR